MEFLLDCLPSSQARRDPPGRTALHGNLTPSMLRSKSQHRFLSAAMDAQRLTFPPTLTQPHEIQSEKRGRRGSKILGSAVSLNK
jgi:hypothetical protein